MPADPVPAKPSTKGMELLLGISLWQDGPYLGLYRGRNGYVVCAVVSPTRYVCGSYRSFEEAINDYVAAVRQWMEWARRSGLNDVAKALEEHVERLVERRLLAAAIT